MFSLTRLSVLGAEAIAGRVIVQPQYGTNRDTVAFLASVFGLTGENKRNLISVLVLLAGGPRERALKLRFLTAEGGETLRSAGAPATAWRLSCFLPRKKPLSVASSGLNTNMSSKPNLTLTGRRDQSR